MKLFLGVDGGQSSTKAVVADELGQVLGRGQGGPANHADEPGGKARLESAVRLAAGSAVQQAGLGELRSVLFQCAYFAMTGGARAKETTIRRWIRARKIKVEQDTRAAWAGALGCRPGIVVIAGTGSVAFGVSAAGSCVQVGGWGYLFGDEGSAFHLARRAVTESVRSEEGWGVRTGLVEELSAGARVSGSKELMARVYSGELHRDELAALAQVVLECARRGDRVARDLRRETAGHIALLVAAAVELLKLRKNAPLHVSVVGGLAQSQELWRDIRRTVHRLFPDAQVCRPLFSPEMGALFMAYEAHDPNLCAEVVGRMRGGK